MQIRKSMFVIVLIIILGFSAIYGERIIVSSELQKKIQESSIEELIPINIVMKARYDRDVLIRNSATLSKVDKRSYVIQELKSFTEYHQADVLSDLESLHDEKVENITPLWASNIIHCNTTSEVINNLIKRDDIDYIDYNEIQKIVDNNVKDVDQEQKGITWSVSQVNADDVWDSGYTGQGIVVAMIDTGVNYNHVDLADHLWISDDYPNHGWDFFYNDNDPMDEYGHGTHCAGIVAGDGTAGTQTGVAPDAQIMCLKMSDNQANTSEAILWNALQFAIEHGADIISASWGIPHVEGLERRPWRDIMDTILAAGMIASVAAGNYGDYLLQLPPPDNIATPADCPPPWLHPDQDEAGGISSVVCVGATNSDDVVAHFSSRGPVTWQDISGFNDYAYDPGIGLIRPDIVAPGVNITSLDFSDTYGYIVMDGTSMATPCVAGVMALMLSKNTDLTPGEIDGILEENVYEITTTKSNDYGSGRVDALAAINHIYNHGALEGTISDESTGNPIENAQITASGYTTYTVSTNYCGEYMIENIPSGTYVIECVAEGYNTVLESGIIVNPDDTTLHDFSMNAPVMNVTSGSIIREVAPYSPIHAEVNIENLGAGELIWNATAIDTNQMIILSPECDTVPAGDSSVLSVNFTIGNYAYGDNLTCSVVIESDPNVGSVTIPVTVTVVEPEYGGVNGTVISTNEGIPIPNATITVMSYVDTTYTITTNSMGIYTLSDLIIGSYRFEYSADNYNKKIESNIEIIPEEIKTYDVSLDAPIISITPTEIEKKISPDSLVEFDVMIENVGSGDLFWSASINDRSAIPISIPPASDDFPRGTSKLSCGPASLNHSQEYGPNKPELILPKSSLGYGIEIMFQHFGISVDLNTPSIINTIFFNVNLMSVAGSFGTESADHMYYMTGDTWELVYADINTGSYETIGFAGTSFEDMTCDMSTGIMYGLSYNGIYTIDLTDGSCSKIGDIGCEAMIAIAIDGNGDMWGHEISRDEIWYINKETGEGTSVGSTGFDANFDQSMAWDPVTKNVYLAAFNNSNDSYELRVADTTTGATALLGSVEYREVVVLSFPPLDSWINLDTMSGVVTAGESSTLPVILNTIGREYGEVFTCDIVIETYPDIGTLTIPVTLEVDDVSIGENPMEYETDLIGNFPNPMKHLTTFSFSIRERSHVRLSVYNIRGQVVEKLIDDDVEPSALYNITWDGTSKGKKLANGVYLYKLEVNNQSYMKKMILMR